MILAFHLAMGHLAAVLGDHLLDRVVHLAPQNISVFKKTEE
jgi:hypothetical protein